MMPLAHQPPFYAPQPPADALAHQPFAPPPPPSMAAVGARYVPAYQQTTQVNGAHPQHLSASCCYGGGAPASVPLMPGIQSYVHAPSMMMTMPMAPQTTAQMMMFGQPPGMSMIATSAPMATPPCPAVPNGREAHGGR